MRSLYYNMVTEWVNISVTDNMITVLVNIAVTASVNIAVTVWVNIAVNASDYCIDIMRLLLYSITVWSTWLLYPIAICGYVVHGSCDYCICSITAWNHGATTFGWLVGCMNHVWLLQMITVSNKCYDDCMWRYSLITVCIYCMYFCVSSSLKIILPFFFFLCAKFSFNLKKLEV